MFEAKCRGRQDILSDSKRERYRQANRLTAGLRDPSSRQASELPTLKKRDGNVSRLSLLAY